jgi:hypothetical protein
MFQVGLLILLYIKSKTMVGYESSTKLMVETGVELKLTLSLRDY